MPPFAAERIALEAARRIGGERILALTLGRAQAARQLAVERPGTRVACWMLDEFRRQLAVEECATIAAGLQTAEAGPHLGNLDLVCCSDPPQEACDLAVVPLSMRGEAELARDQLQLACRRLTIGGALVAAVDNPRDEWLRRQMEELFDKVTVEHEGDGVAYVARKLREPRRYRNFEARFAFRDRGRLVKAVSRPGVFSHRHIDPGARRLLDAAEVAAGERVLDIGCGAGAVGLALAAREPSLAVHAVDSHVRAVDCTAAGALLNGLSNVTVELNCRGDYLGAGAFDLAVANPPYYADFRIAELFIAAAQRSLRDGGRLILVTKQGERLAAALGAGWDDVEVFDAKGYVVGRARKRRC